MFQKTSVITKFVLTLAVPAIALAIIAVFAVIDQPLDSTVIAAVAGAGVIGSVVIALAMAKSLTKPLRELGQAMADVSERRLPAVVAQLSAPELLKVPPPFNPVLTGATGEMGALADAVNAVGAVTDQVATQNADLLRKGIGDIFVNLARRNQALLDRQIEFIDDLEAVETDPKQLKNLYTLDHLATRMRRNADSLLVLAGADAPRKRGQPVQLCDVVRVAVGEIEQYTRLKLALSDSATVSAVVAADLAHLLSELMENAAQFSPPDTQVEVIGRREPDGDRFLLLVRDHGVGMAPQQLDEFNSQIASPPSIGLTVSRALGFTVVGHLARRHGINVQLRTGPDHGVDAAVLIPAALLDPEATVVPVRVVDDPYALPTLAPEPTPSSEPVPPLPTPVAAAPASAPAPPLPPPPPPPPVVMTQPPSAPPASTRTDTHPEIPPTPTRQSTGSSTPAPAMAPDDSLLEGLTRRPLRHGEPSGQPEPAGRSGTVAAARRTPEQVRNMLSRYRGGLQRGRTDVEGGPDHPDAEGGPDHPDAEFAEDARDDA